MKTFLLTEKTQKNSNDFMCLVVYRTKKTFTIKQYK